MFKIRDLHVHLCLGLLNKGFDLKMIRFRHARAHTHKQTNEYPPNTRATY